MTTYKFTGSQTTDFPYLDHVDGIGVRLEPGDTVDCAVDPVDVVDGDGTVVGQRHPGNPWLVPATPDAPKAAVPITAPAPTAPPSAAPVVATGPPPAV